jgi:hypothetical protein
MKTILPNVKRLFYRALDLVRIVCFVSHLDYETLLFLISSLILIQVWILGFYHYWACGFATNYVHGPSHPLVIFLHSSVCTNIMTWMDSSALESEIWTIPFSFSLDESGEGQVGVGRGWDYVSPAPTSVPSIENPLWLDWVLTMIELPSFHLVNLYGRPSYFYLTLCR